MRKVHICSGIPASGKSTYIADHAELCNIVLHRDDFRAQVRDILGTTAYFPLPSNEEWTLWLTTINTRLLHSPHIDFYIDQTTIGTKALAKLLRGLFLTGNDIIIVHKFNTPLEVCLELNACRTGHEFVPEDVIVDMHRNHIDPNKAITKSTANSIMSQVRGDKAVQIEVIIHE